MSPSPAAITVPPWARQLGLVVVLVATWLLLWGEVTLANVVVGALLGVVIVRIVPVDAEPQDLILRPAAVLHLAGFMARQALVSNVLLARTVLSRKSMRCTGVLAVPLPTGEGRLGAVYIGLIALTPGTICVEIEDDGSFVYIHVLDVRDIEAVRGDLHRLRDLTTRAIGSPEAVAFVEEHP